MELELKKGIYMDRFPFPLNVMMAEQLSDAHVEKQSHLTYLIQFFGKWRKTKEGAVFWSEILSIYHPDKVSLHGLPSNDEILAICKEHNVLHPNQQWKTEEKTTAGKGQALAGNQLEINLRFR